MVSADVFSTLINVAGRQRMLSQRIVLKTLRAALGRAQALSEAEQALQQFKSAHLLLVQGGKDLPGLFCESIRQAYFGPSKADERIRAFMAQADAALKDARAGGGADAASVAQLEELATPMLVLLNDITQVYEQEARAHASELKRHSANLLGQIVGISREARIVAFNARVIAARSVSGGPEFAVVAGELSRITDEIDRLANSAIGQPAAA
ncbi:type IV pili methyl-accepting chemotaxis transducer N-terminal domain-containing protein [Aquabacterium sp.]|uniref:type IV pili methyl-accepting chemotaxis transducer N-terminal domain-containing protein n=1 Tax=Aquabacterium sp. TaxID=1872578 RepID=UPI0035B461FA